MLEGVVYTSEAIQMRFFLDLYLAKNYPILIVGPDASGKSLITSHQISSILKTYNVHLTAFSCNSTTQSTQDSIFSNIERFVTDLAYNLNG